MKTTLCKQVTLMCILLLLMIYATAKTKKEQSNLLLFHLLNDSTAVKASIQKTPAAITLQTTVQNFVVKYLNEHATLLTSIKQRNSSSFTLIQNILVKRGIPAELLYLAVVESKLKNRATSGAGAVGIWQLMPVTARSLGLQVNGKTDERKHLYQSSLAAADYLNTLYKKFDDWLLVVAAYNCGAGNVYKAIKQSGSRDFWKLQQFLPTETRNHVKRFIATHYYYEEKGSVVTLTKKERNKWLASLPKFEELKNETVSNITPTNQYFNWVLITQYEDEMFFLARK